MTTQYIKPTILNSKLFLTAHSQYSFIFTPENCPGGVPRDEGHFTDTSLSHCDQDTLDEIRQEPDFNIFITCANISGTYHVVLFNSQTQLTDGLNCSVDQIPVTAPTSVSPALTEDCIVNSISAPSESGISCDL